MTRITAEALEKVKSKWEDFCQDDGHAVESLAEISEFMSQRGLDLDKDETYALLEPGLTKAAYEDIVTEKSMLRVLGLYHAALQKTASDYTEEYYARRTNQLTYLLHLLLPDAEKRLAKTGIPEYVSLLTEQQFSMIMDAYYTGALQNEIKLSAYIAAQDLYRTSLSIDRRMKEKASHGVKEEDFIIRDNVKIALGLLRRALDFIEKADDLYHPEEILVERHLRGSLVRNGATATFDRSSVKALHKEFLSQKLNHDFSEAVSFQEKGHFLIDPTGGYGATLAPVQEIAAQLDEYGYDLKDSSVYELLGTDKETFKERYQKERASIIDSGNKDILRPEFKL